MGTALRVTLDNTIHPISITVPAKRAPSPWQRPAKVSERSTEKHDKTYAISLWGEKKKRKKKKLKLQKWKEKCGEI